MRKALRGAVEFAMVASGLPALGRHRRRGDTLVLAYHNVVPDHVAAFGDRALHLPLERFRQHVGALRLTHDIVGIDELDSPRRTDRPRAAITFDDAYAGALQLAVPLLVELGVPATIFVAPALLGRDAMWWDLLADPVHGLEEGVRRHALEALRGEHEAVMSWAGNAGVAVHEASEHARIGTLEELARVAHMPGITIGSHTWSHPNLARLDADATQRELARAREWLAAHLGASRPWLAYPYGRFSATTTAAAHAAGLVRGFRVDGGWMGGDDQPALATPRLNVPAGLSERGFVLRLAGLVPA